MKNIKELEQDMVRVRNTLIFYVKEMEFLERRMRMLERRGEASVKRPGCPKQGLC